MICLVIALPPYLGQHILPKGGLDSPPLCLLESTRVKEKVATIIKNSRLIRREAEL